MYIHTCYSVSSVCICYVHACRDVGYTNARHIGNSVVGAGNWNKAISTWNNGNPAQVIVSSWIDVRTKILNNVRLTSEIETNVGGRRCITHHGYKGAIVSSESNATSQGKGTPRGSSYVRQ